MRQIKYGFTLLACLLMFGGKGMCDDKPFIGEGESTNAALIYWQAFAMLPDLDPSDGEMLKKIEAGEMSVDAAKEILQQSEAALNLARDVNSSMDCHWEVVRRGPNTLLPHLSKARLLARLMLLDARAQMEAGNHDEAIKQLAGSWLVARNIDEGVLLQLLVANAIETLTLDVAKTIAASEDDSAVAQLAGLIEELPVRATLASSMAYERDVFVGWLAPILSGEPETARDAIAPLFGNGDTASVAAILGGDDAERNQRVTEFESLFDAVIEALGSDDSDAQVAKLDKQIEKSENVLVRMMMPSFSRVYEQHQALLSRFDQLAESLSERNSEE